MKSMAVGSSKVKNSSSNEQITVKESGKDTSDKRTSSQINSKEDQMIEDIERTEVNQIA